MPDKPTGAKHTPGPWKWYWRVDEDDHADCGVFWERREGQAVSICRAPRYEKQAQWKANAALISSAPDLLASLQHLTDAVSPDGGVDDLEPYFQEPVKRALEVISRAKGGE